MSPLHGLTLGDVLREHGRSRPGQTAAVDVHQAAEIGDAVQAARTQSGAASARWIQHDNGEYEAFVTAGSADDPDVPVESGEAVLLMYTAAFSGRPNAAMLSNTALIGQALTIGKLAEIDATYVYLNCGPLFHIATFWATLATFLMGGTNVFTPRVDPEEL